MTKFYRLCNFLCTLYKDFAKHGRFFWKRFRIFPDWGVGAQYITEI